MEQYKRRKPIKEVKKQTFRRQLHYHLYEGCLILVFTFSIFLFIALLSYHRSDPGWSHSIVVKHVANLTGKAGAWLSDFILYMVGYLAYIFPLITIIVSSWAFFIIEVWERIFSLNGLYGCCAFLVFYWYCQLDPHYRLFI